MRLVTSALARQWLGNGMENPEPMLSGNAAHPDRVESLVDIWTWLQNAGLDRLQFLGEAMGRLAPRPGSLVVLQARSVDATPGEFKPSLLSAIDARTHLQLGRLYYTLNAAATIDFVEFLVVAFPFRLTEIRTPFHPLFMDPSINQSDHRFTRALGIHGIRHTLSDSPDRSVIDYLSQYFFQGFLPDSLREHSVNHFLRELRNHLYFHNNHRSFPLLAGNTAVRTLAEIAGSSSLRVFDPFDFPSRVPPLKNGD